jgi:hypothetical protein
LTKIEKSLLSLTNFNSVEANFIDVVRRTKLAYLSAVTIKQGDRYIRPLLAPMHVVLGNAHGIFPVMKKTTVLDVALDAFIVASSFHCEAAIRVVRRRMQIFSI